MHQTKIPFELYNDHVFVSATVGDSEPLWFFLDTGAQATVIDLKRAESLGLKQEGRIPLGAAGDETMEGILLSDSYLKVTGLDGFSVPIQVAFPFDMVNKAAGRQIDGVLGVEFFNAHVVEIDYQKKELSIFDKSSFKYDGNGEKIPLTFENNHPHTNGVLVFKDGTEIRADFVIDTGAAASLLMTRSFAEKHKLAEKIAPKIDTLDGLGGAGATTGIIGRISKFRLGKTTVDEPLTTLSKDSKGVLATDEAFEGIIGVEILKLYKVIFDYSRSEMILEKTPATEHRQVYDMSGMQLMLEDKDFKVTCMLENSPAKEADIRLNDVLIEFEGKPASSLTLEHVQQRFLKAGKVSLKIRRGEEYLDKEIELRELI